MATCVRYLSFLLLIVVSASTSTSPPRKLVRSSTSASSSSPTTSGTLRYVILIHRHGDRAPTDRLAAVSEAQFNQMWPNGAGELTSIGMNQLFMVGQTLRSKYVGPNATVSPNFLSANFNQFEYRVRSTDYNRTLMSAQSLLYGLFPLGTGPNLPSGNNPPALPSNFQPIPIHTIPLAQDDLLIGKDFAYYNCPTAHSFLTGLPQTPAYQDQQRANAALLAALTNITGEPAALTSITKINDNFVCYGAHGYLQQAFPTLTEAQRLSTLSLAQWYLRQTVGNQQDNCLSNYVLMHDILAHFAAIATPTQQARAKSRVGRSEVPSTKQGHGALSMHSSAVDTADAVNANQVYPTRFVHYSAHDSTLYPLLATLGNFNGTNPPYASHVVLELWQTPGGSSPFAVKASFQDQDFVLPGCGGQVLCPYSAFSSFFSTCGLPAAQFNYVKLCGADPYADAELTQLRQQLHDANNKVDNLTIAVAVVAAAAGCVIVLGVLLHLRRSKSEADYASFSEPIPPVT